MKENYKLLQNIYKNMSDEYYHDLHIINFIPIKGTQDNKIYIQNTINIYSKYHNDFDKSKLLQVLSEFEDICQNDIVVSFDNNNILLRLYTILSSIHQTQLNLKTIVSDNYLKDSFAKYNQDKREVLREALRYKDKLTSKKTKKLSTKHSDDRFNWKTFKLYHKDKEIFNFFLHNMVIGDISKIASIYKTKQETIDTILEQFEYMGTQKTTKSAILKSLWIILYFKSKTQLKQDNTQSEQIAYSLMINLFDYDLKKIDSKIYIKSIINLVPIFGASRKVYYTPNKIFLIEKMLKEENIAKSIPKEYFLKALDNILNKPQLHYIQKYPIELVKINKKYENILNN